MIFLIPAPGQANHNKPQFEDDNNTKEKKLEDETVIQAEEKLPPESKEPLINARVKYPHCR